MKIATVQQGTMGLPYIPSQVHYTEAGTPYLQAPGVAMISRPVTAVGNMADFLGGFDEELKFPQYLEDNPILETGVALCKAAGQLCYMSFGPKRTKNEKAQQYFDNIKSSGHGSVFEHSNFSFLLYGIGRSVTHELVRSRVGVAYSQVSQRYVDGKVLRFVERPEYQDDQVLHAMFEARIDRMAQEYQEIADHLMKKQKQGSKALSAEKQSDLRKKVNQAARSGLANETEAPMIMTGNIRAWRHIIEMRANEHAEVEIRELAFRIFQCLRFVEPTLFADYTVHTLNDNTRAVSTAYRKV